MDYPMFDALDDPTRSRNEDERFELLQDLERNTSEAIRRARSSERIAIRCSIIVQPGNSSQADSLKVRGVTGNISSGGFQALLPTPLMVGDIYRVTFDRQTLDAPPTFARCLRCRLIREDAFESGFAFFNPLDLSRLNQDAA